MSTSFYPPFLLARLCATIDHIARGRLGWNIVTSAEDQAAQNFGMDKLYEHDVRYEMADEYLDLVSGCGTRGKPMPLSATWSSGVYADHTKVTRRRLRGKVLQVPGPLNTVRPPQGRPVLCQAGASPQGKAVRGQVRRHDRRAGSQTPSAMKEFRADIRARMEAHRPQARRLQGAVPRSRRSWPTRSRKHTTRLHRWMPRSTLHRVRPRGDLVDHRDRLLPVRPRPAAAAGHDQRRARLPRAASPSGPRARRCEKRGGSAGYRARRRAGRHARTRSPTRWARSWKRSAATGSSSRAR